MTNRRFFIFGPTYRGGDHGLELDSESEFLVPGRISLGPPEIGGRGFPAFPRVPRLVPNKKFYHRPPKDLEQFGYYWLVSQRLKNVLDELDSQAVVFSESETLHISGKPIEPKHYLCDVIRELDAIDRDKSEVKIEVEDGEVFYNLLGSKRLEFVEEMVCSLHIFRQKNMAAVICDDELKDACFRAGIRDAMLFRDVTSL
jgi:hypothetical protein